MSFLDAGGVSKISQLTIDADKDWAGMGISNIKEVVLGMGVGDLIYHNGTQLVKLSPGVISTELLTKGPSYPPKWGFPDTG